MKLEKVFTASHSFPNGHAYVWWNSPDKYVNGFASCHIWMSFEKTVHKGLANAQIFLPLTHAVQPTFP